MGKTFKNYEELLEKNEHLAKSLIDNVTQGEWEKKKYTPMMTLKNMLNMNL